MEHDDFFTLGGVCTAKPHEVVKKHRTGTISLGQPQPLRAPQLRQRRSQIPTRKRSDQNDKSMMIDINCFDQTSLLSSPLLS
ncbi:hypothetical protein FHS57_005625 [Runella defluvii]|uniref:Uncharacterized protein n=1 Tax=Runella defluvii TaxID=370973 RepID=A0A7W5ZRI7_9BACT|nr:hypothetical protein [Runella defluvii]